MNQQIVRRDVDQTTGEIVEFPGAPAELKILDVYADGGVAEEEPRIDALATISAGYRAPGKEGHQRLPQVSRDGTIYLHDPKNRAPNLKLALAARDNKALTIAFPFHDPAAFVQQRFTEYSSTRLLAYGDEFTLTTIGEKGERKTYDEGTADYEAIKRRCKVSISIYFALAEWTPEGPRVVFPDGLGLYRLRSTSRNTLRNLRAAIAQVSTFTHGQLAGIPFDIGLDYRDVAGPDGSRRNVPCWVFTMRPPEPLSSRTFAPRLTEALREGRLLQLPAPTAETLEYAALEGPAEDDYADYTEIREPSEAEVDLIARGGACDAHFYEALWFTTVRGTRFDSDEARADFVFEYSERQHDSLAEFLTTLTNGEAEEFISRISVVIQEETEAARRAEARARMDAKLQGRSVTEFMNQALGDGIDDYVPPAPASTAVDPPADPPPADTPRITRGDLIKAYNAKYQQAEGLGLQLDGLALVGTESSEVIVQKGSQLADLIAQYESQQPGLL